MRQARGWILTVGLLAAVTACTSGDDADQERMTTASSTTTTTTIAEYTPEPIAWQPCEDDLECAEVAVPLNYAEPDGTKINVTVTRAQATRQRIGPLFVYPGGPGGSARGFVLGLRDRGPAALREQFDLVGVEWRGTGATDFECGVSFPELYSVDPTIEGPEDRVALLDVSQRYVDGCAAQAGDLLSFIGSDEAARDLDAVRAAMGDEQLSFFGISYGTMLGQMYAGLFPQRLRAMVIDGITEPGSTGLDAGTTQSLGFERMLDSFVADCDANPGCPLAGTTMATVDTLMAQVETSPLPAEGGQVGPAEFQLALASHLYTDAAWVDLSEALAEGLRGNGQLLWDAAESFTSGFDFDVYFAGFCIDQEWPENPDEVLAAAKNALSQAPHVGEALVNDYVRCALWPVDEEPLPTVTAPGAPPILVVSTTGDAATPHEVGVRVAERLESGVLLTVEGNHHSSAAGASDCASDHAANYLLSVTPPPEGIVCPAE